MQIGNSNHNYAWHEKWVEAPGADSVKDGWAHHGIVVSSKTGNVITFHQSEPKILVFSQQGELVNSWEAGVENAHGMTLVQENNDEFLWLADNLSGQVVKVSVDGDQSMSISRPDIDIYNSGEKYSPTDVAVYEEKNGGNGDIIVADGYVLASFIFILNLATILRPSMVPKVKVGGLLLLTVFGLILEKTTMNSI